MKVKINEKLICIPPHISTTWDQVTFLHTEEESGQLILVLHLSNGKVVKIPHLDSSIIDIAFAAHMRYLESAKPQEAQARHSGGIIQTLFGLSPDQLSAFPFKIGIGNAEGLEMAFQHNPSQSNAPLLPPEIIEKIASIAKTLTNGDLSGFPKPEPHCNCMHCQVARAIHHLSSTESQGDEELITEEDLCFRTWEVRQVGEKLYMATNPLDPREQYNVYLGSPVGCTCGQAHCEHIKAVLSS